MAPVSYYYLISILLVATPLFWLINLIYLKRKGRTLLGQAYKIGSADYKSVIKLASIRNLIITSIITLLTLANLAWSVMTVLRLNTSSAHLLLVAAPIAILIAWIFMTIRLRKEYGTSEPITGKHKKAVRKSGKDSDSWLS